MSAQTDPKTGQSVPDTATTYERAKPSEESASKSLQPPAPKRADEKDHIAPHGTGTDAPKQAD